MMDMTATQGVIEVSNLKLSNVEWNCAGMIGAGVIGGRIAPHLCKIFEKVLVWNRTFEKAEECSTRHEKLRAVRNIEEIFEECNIVFVCLATTDNVEGILNNIIFKNEEMAKTKIEFVVDCTSGEPEKSAALGLKLKEKGIVYIDAPVSGGPDGASNATLCIMVGANSDADFKLVFPALCTFGAPEKVIHVGKVGMGNTVKCINNIMGTAHVVIAAEALVALNKAGVSPDLALKVINNSSGYSGMTVKRFPNHILNRAFDNNFTIGLLKKDCNIAESVLEKHFKGAETLLKASSICQQTATKYGDHVDDTFIVKHIEELAGKELPKLK
eukprot:Nk52_evm93s2192 gene=Nk52_evmTU93s2192